MRAEINEIETKETIAKINKTKSWFSKKKNKIDKTLARLIKKKRERTQINKIRPWENHRSKRVMYQNVHCSSIYNSQDMEAT